MAIYVKRGTHWTLDNNNNVLLTTDDDTGLLATEYESSPYTAYVKTSSGADLLDWYEYTPQFLLDNNNNVILASDDDTGLILNLRES